MNAPTIGQLRFTSAGVEKLLQDLNPRKASGPDEISARLLQRMAKQLAPAVAAIYNQSLESGTLLQCLNSGSQPGSLLCLRKVAQLKP